LSQYSENQFACFYEFPSGFLPIATILSNETTRYSLSQSNIFKLGEALLQSMEVSSTSTFAFHSLDPSSILWSPITGEHLLVGIGASLGVGKYFCSIPGCKSPSTESEIGISATVFHFGLLFYQLLVGHCPVSDIHNTQSRYETTKLSDLLSQLSILPHFRMILGRLLNPDPDRRYSSLKDLSFDFIQANSSRKEIETIPSTNLEKKVLATLKDFVDFRLRIISRNPNMSSSSPIIRVGRVIEELANTIQYLPPDMTRLWSVGLENQAIFAEFPSSSHAKRISPEGRRLLDIAYGWEKFHKDRLTTLDRPTALTRLLLYRTLAIESLATFAGIILGLSDEEKTTITNQTTEFSRIIDASMIQDEIEKEVALQTDVSKYQLTLSKKDLLDLQRMPNWISKKSNILEFVPSLRILGIFLVINSNNVDVFVDDIIKFRTKLALQSRTKNVSKLIWIMLKVLPTLDEQMTDFYSLCNTYSNNHKILFENNIWARFEDYYRYMHGFNLAKRKAAQVYSYQVKNYRNEVEGLIEIVSFRTLSLPFETKGTFISGNPAIIDQEILRPVLVDIIYENKKTPVLSAVLAPMARFLELPFKRRRLSPYKILSFFKGHKNLYKVIQGLSLLVLILLVWILSETIISSISGSPNPIAQGILTVVSAIFASLYGDNIKKFMNVMNPEDNDQILKKK